MKKSTYCFWLLASTAAGNKITDDERRMLQRFLSKENTLSR